MIIIIDLISIPITIDIILTEVEDIGMSEAIIEKIIRAEQITEDIRISEEDIKTEGDLQKNTADPNMIEDQKIPRIKIGIRETTRNHERSMTEEIHIITAIQKKGFIKRTPIQQAS